MTEASRVPLPPARTMALQENAVVVFSLVKPIFRIAQCRPFHDGETHQSSLMNSSTGERSSAAKGRFLIIDQSLRSFQGHHFEYDVSVAEAAARAGWEPIIFAHKSLSREAEPSGVGVVRAFRLSWYGEFSGRLRWLNDRVFRPLNPLRLIGWLNDSFFKPLARYVRRVVFTQLPSRKTRGALSKSRRLANR